MVILLPTVVSGSPSSSGQPDGPLPSRSRHPGVGIPQLPDLWRRPGVRGFDRVAALVGLVWRVGLRRCLSRLPSCFDCNGAIGGKQRGL